MAYHGLYHVLMTRGDHRNFVKIMKRKFDQLIDWYSLHIHDVLHLDWAAGNPNDVLQTPEKSSITWTKTLVYGDWLTNRKGERDVFIETHVKRIPGWDIELLRKCGISPAFVWLPLHDKEAVPAAAPMTSPKLKNSVMTKEDDKETTVDIIDENAVPEEVHKLYSFLDSKEFQERMFNCYIYAVRVVAIRTMTSGPAAPVNMFTGPRIRLRHATLLAAGGWIVPPMEERDPLGERGGFKKPPQPPAQRAMPIKLDHTGRKPPKYSGELAPIWDLPADPTLEDVYWMTWQLLSGTTYVGFQTGSGFGKDRDRNGRGDTAMLAQCPFDNPSGESLRYSATPKTDNDAGAGPSKDDGSGSGKDDESGPGKDDGSGPGKDDDSPTISDAELYDA